MKFIMEENDKKIIESISKDLETGDSPLLIRKEFAGRYSFEFEVLDPVKANLFTLLMMSSDKEITQKIIDTFGINVTHISFLPGDRKIRELKEYLEEFIRTIDTI